MKLLGIDYGRRRVGIATSDETGQLMRGITTIDRKKKKNYLDTLNNIISNEKPSKIILGVPLGPNDEETVMSLEIREFAVSLKKNLDTPIPIEFIDESYSSIEADRALSFRKKKVREKKGMRDMIAACNILTSYRNEQL